MVVFDVWRLYCEDAASTFLSIGERVVDDVVPFPLCGVFSVELVLLMFDN